MQKKSVKVAIGIIKKDGQYLVGWRKAKQHQGGCYEFIGGKVNNKETPQQALVRECFEEINITIERSYLLKTLTHEYEEIIVELYIYEVIKFSGTAIAKEGQELKWVNAFELQKLAMPAANDDIKKLALLNAVYFISSAYIDENWLIKYSHGLPKHALFYFRDYELPPKKYFSVLAEFSKNRADVKIIIHYKYANELLKIYEQLPNVVGFHLSEQDSENVNEHLKIDKKWLCISACHDKNGLIRANQSNKIDAVTLSPVKQTQTHPNAQPMGFDGFEKVIKNSQLPVFALGGMKMNDLQKIQEMGGYGIAGISMLSTTN